MRNRNICLTIHSLAPKGGEERMCSVLANALSRGGNNVVVVTLNMFYKEQCSFPLDKGIKRYTLCGNRLERKVQKYIRSIPLLKYKYILYKHHIDYVIDVDVHQSLVTSKVTRNTNIKVVSWDHFNYERFVRRPTRKALHDCFMNCVNKLVVLTESDRIDYIQKEHLPKELVCQIYNPCAFTNDEYVASKSKKVLAIGRLEEQKGFDMLLKAWAIVEASDSEWELEIVGDGNQKQQLIDLAQKFNLHRVVFSPFTANIKEKYRKASLYVLSSRYEGLGLVIIEAMTMGLPVVSFNCKAGPSELIEDEFNGFLVEANNVHQLANKILEVIKNKELRNRVGYNAFKSSKKYHINNILQKWITLLDSL